MNPAFSQRFENHSHQRAFPEAARRQQEDLLPVAHVAHQVPDFFLAVDELGSFHDFAVNERIASLHKAPQGSGVNSC